MKQIKNLNISSSNRTRKSTKEKNILIDDISETKYLYINY